MSNDKQAEIKPKKRSDHDRNKQASSVYHECPLASPAAPLTGRHETGFSPPSEGAASSTTAWVNRGGGLRPQYQIGSNTKALRSLVSDRRFLCEVYVASHPIGIATQVRSLGVTLIADKIFKTMNEPDGHGLQLARDVTSRAPLQFDIYSSALRAAKPFVRFMLLLAPDDGADKVARRSRMFPVPNYTPDHLFGALAMSSAIPLTASRCAILMATAGPGNDATRMTHRSTGPAHNAAPPLSRRTRGCAGGLARGADNSFPLSFTSGKRLAIPFTRDGSR
jgi:hypothetical protein